ncbi:MAG: ABC transporter permease [Treponema sp.]|jgi:peptide/nickel transport system permease protein|nr:ABC transporter permease [Treponema sp.]
MENPEKGTALFSAGMASEAEQEKLLQRERRVNSAFQKLIRNKLALIGLVIVIFMTTLAIFAPLLTRYTPTELDMINAYAKPGTGGHVLGMDELGRDLLSRIIYGARVSMIVAVGSMSVGAVIGILIGLVAGYNGGLIDSLLMRVMDGMFAFPFVLLAILLVTVLGDGMKNVILAIGIANVPGYARIVRGQVHVVKNDEYCVAAEVLGASVPRLLFLHILPNCLSPIIIYATLNVAGAIISEASLSFLGLGIQPPTPSWGNILRAGSSALITAPHIAAFSGLAISITVLGFNIMGDGIRDMLDPKMKK